MTGEEKTKGGVPTNESVLHHLNTYILIFHEPSSQMQILQPMTEISGDEGVVSNDLQMLSIAKEPDHLPSPINL